MYVPKHFKTQEFIPPAVYETRGEKAIELMDSRILITMDTLRENLGLPITINSYSWGGNRSQSGLRDVDFYGSLAKWSKSLSQHKFGRACDFLVKGMSAHEVRKHIIENKELYPYISFMEVGEGMTWCHIDCRNSPFRLWDMNSGQFVSERQVLEQKL